MAALLTTLVQTIFNLLYVALLARVLLAWVNMDPYHPVMEFLNRLTDPILAPIRQILPQTGMFDFSPLLAFFALNVLQYVLVEVVRILFI